MGGWGWLEKWGLKLISTQVVVEVEVGVELGNWGLGMGSWRLGTFQAKVVDVVGDNLSSLDVLKYFFLINKHSRVSGVWGWIGDCLDP